MVWQVRDETCQNQPDEQAQTCSNKPEIESRSSRGSSSVDLGPAPGSGLVTTDASEASDTETNSTKHERQLSMGVEMTESMTASSLMQFNKDVESLLEHGGQILENELAKEASEEPLEEPKEDFTQQFQ